MSMRTGVLTLSLFAACGPLEPFPLRAQPINQCDESACSLYEPYNRRFAAAACEEGECRVTAAIDRTIYAISVPQTSYFAPGVTFLLYEKDVRNLSAPCALAVPCISLPLALHAEGQYVPGGAVVGSAIKADLGNGFLATALPVSAAYFPLVQLRDGRYADAASLGMGALPIVADKVSFPPGVGAAGPFGGASPGFRATLAPGSYARTLLPEPAFDVFPPDTRGAERAIKVGQGGSLFERVSVDQVDLAPTVLGEFAIPEFTLLREDAPFDGWSAHLREVTTGRRISSRAHLNGRELRVRFHSHRLPLDGDALSNAELVVTPDRSELPTLVVFKQAGQPFDRVEYPALPSPARVSGRIRHDGLDVEADVIIRSTRVYISDPELGFSQSLGWSTTLSTDPSGRFETTLPRGEYALTIIPRASVLAITEASMVVDLANDVQAGRSFTVMPGLSVGGRIRVADGRSLGGAEVELLPAGSLRHPDRSALSIPPRATRGQTSSDGTFALFAGPGTYDLVVRPAAGSKLPWVVRTDVVVSASDLTREAFELSVPAPIVLSFALRDPAGNPIPRAWVRCYAPADGGIVPIEIARGLTDSDGIVELLGAGSPTSGRAPQTLVNTGPHPAISSDVRPQGDAGRL
jgi:hypothetical protein